MAEIYMYILVDTKFMHRAGTWDERGFGSMHDPKPHSGAILDVRRAALAHLTAGVDKALPHDFQARGHHNLPEIVRRRE